MATVRPIDLIGMGLQDAPASLQVRQENKITK